MWVRPSFQASALRTLLLIVDMLPACGLVGLLSMLFTQRSQRLGDLVAKTVVIYENDARTRPMVEKPKDTERIIILPIKHYRVLEQFLARKTELNSESVHQMASELVEALRPLVEASPVAGECPWGVQLDALHWILRHAEPRKEVIPQRNQQ